MTFQYVSVFPGDSELSGLPKKIRSTEVSSLEYHGIVAGVILQHAIFDDTGG